MKAIQIQTPGNAKLVHIKEPSPGKGQVLVKIHGATVNPIDTYFYEGKIPSPFANTPLTPGCEFAGEVTALGEGVTKFNIGDRVWGCNQLVRGDQGAWAEYALVQESFCHPLQDEVSDEAILSVGLNGMTAFLALVETAKLRPDDHVLIHGASGNVGALAVQIAALAQASVVATTSSVEKQHYLESLGAGQVELYNQKSFMEEYIQEQAGTFSLFLSTVPIEDYHWVLQLLGKHARIIILSGRQNLAQVPTGELYTKNINMYGIALFNYEPEPLAEASDYLQTRLAQKKLQTSELKRFALDEHSAAVHYAKQGVSNQRARHQKVLISFNL